MLPLPLAWTYEARLPSEAGISRSWDASVLVISGMCTDAVCSFSLRCRPEEPISIPRCCTRTFYYIDGLERSAYGSRSRTGLTGRDFTDPRACLHYRTVDWANESTVLRGYCLLYRLWARILFDNGASHSFITASCVRELGLEVETLKEPMHVSSPLRTKVSVDLICRGCELDISRILLTLDLGVMDMTEFDVILGMDWLTTHRVVIDCERRGVTAYTQDDTRVTFQGDTHDALPQAVYESKWHEQLMGWLASLTLKDEVKQDLDLPRVVC